MVGKCIQQKIRQMYFQPPLNTPWQRCASASHSVILSGQPKFCPLGQFDLEDG